MADKWDSRCAHEMSNAASFAKAAGPVARPGPTQHLKCTRHRGTPVWRWRHVSRVLIACLGRPARARAPASHPLPCLAMRGHASVPRSRACSRLQRAQSFFNHIVPFCSLFRCDRRLVTLRNVFLHFLTLLDSRCRSVSIVDWLCSRLTRAAFMVCTSMVFMVCIWYVYVLSRLASLDGRQPGATAVACNAVHMTDGITPNNADPSHQTMPINLISLRLLALTRPVDNEQGPDKNTVAESARRRLLFSWRFWLLFSWRH